MAQLRLFNFADEDGARTPETLIIGAANATAWTRLSQPHLWPGGVMVLAGPPKSGKSHMAAAWCQRFRAGLFAGGAVGPAGIAMALDDAELCRDEAALAYAVDRAGADAPLLLVSHSRPADWALGLPDLASRLAAAPLVAIEPPDEAMLAALLKRFCKARFILLTDHAAEFLALRMERSFEAAYAMADALDASGRCGARPVSALSAAKALRLTLEDAPSTEEEGLPETS